MATTWNMPSLSGPTYSRELDTFYELACGNQPRGYRGWAELMEIDRNGAELFTRLDQLFSRAQPEVACLKSTAYGNAYLALGMLSDQVDDWAVARRYLWRSDTLASSSAA